MSNHHHITPRKITSRKALFPSQAAPKRWDALPALDLASSEEAYAALMPASHPARGRRGSGVERWLARLEYSRALAAVDVDDPSESPA